MLCASSRLTRFSHCCQTGSSGLVINGQRARKTGASMECLPEKTNSSCRDIPYGMGGTVCSCISARIREMVYSAVFVTAFPTPLLRWSGYAPEWNHTRPILPHYIYLSRKINPQGKNHAHSGGKRRQKYHKWLAIRRVRKAGQRKPRLLPEGTAGAFLRAAESGGCRIPQPWRWYPGESARCWRGW